MNHLQYYECMNGQWVPDTEEGSFDTILTALERRDEISCDYPNDGIYRGIRAVDEDGNVLEYGKKTF